MQAVTSAHTSFCKNFIYLKAKHLQEKHTQTNKQYTQSTGIQSCVFTHQLVSVDQLKPR